MSFPSAAAKLHAGSSASEALLYAMEHDTPLGFAAVMAVALSTKKENANACPCCVVKGALPESARKDVLRHERRGAGVVIDFAPDSVVGKQIMRLLGTDAARPLMTQRAGMHFGFANCCKVIASEKEEDTRFTPEEQINWQSQIDC